MAQRIKTEGVVVGFTLVALGLLWTLANLGRLDLLATVRTWWPAVLLLWGGLGLLNSLARKGDDREGLK